MDDHRNFAAVSFVAYALGAGLALSQTDPGRTVESLLPGGFLGNVVIGGIFVGAITILALLGIATLTRTTYEVVQWPREVQVAAGQFGAIALWLGANAWVAAPYDVRGDEWIGSPVSQEEMLLLRSIAIGMLAFLILSFLWIFNRGGNPTSRNSQTEGN